MRGTEIWGRLTTWADAILEPILDVAAPRVCAACQEALAEGTDGVLCASCRARQEFLPPQRCPACGGPLNASPLAQCDECMAADERPWRVAVSAFAFRGETRRLVHRLKFRRQLPLAVFFAEALAAAWRTYGAGFGPDVVTSVPLHWTRRWLRGYNQSEEVARRLADRLKLPYRRLLTRTRRTPAQSTLAAQGRKRNLVRAFRSRAAAQKDLRGRRVLLVDDVFTTGATLAAAAESLLAGGADSVAVITIARAV